jgi:hypothetical protein
VFEFDGMEFAWIIDVIGITKYIPVFQDAEI